MNRMLMIVMAAVFVAWPLSRPANAEIPFFQITDQGDRDPLSLRIGAGADPGLLFPWEAGHEADTLLLSCMDFRLISSVEKYMEKIGKKGEYDYIVLAGASLGVNNTTFPEWGLEFWQHVTLARDLHNIKNIMIIDHRNCGAYKAFLNDDFPENGTKAQGTQETAEHKKQLDELANAIHAKYPFLGVQTRLMALDGTVEEIGNVHGVGPLPGSPAVTH